MGTKLQEHLATAEFQGKEAAIAGASESSCPFLGTLEHRGGITYSPEFRRRWLKGHRLQVLETLNAKKAVKALRRRTAKEKGVAHG